MHEHVFTNLQKMGVVCQLRADICSVRPDIIIPKVKLAVYLDNGTEEKDLTARDFLTKRGWRVVSLGFKTVSTALAYALAVDIRDMVKQKVKK